ncbi:MAG: hypothetical protein QOI26_104 [Pseudonocardiales bacterium]|nr:hypothetical protein [Pseudonocardiales bacterium]
MLSSDLPAYGAVRYCPAGHWQPRPGTRLAGQAHPTATFRVRRDARKLELNGQLTEWPAEQLFIRRCTTVVRTEDPNTGRAVSILCGQEWVESTEGSTDY